MIIGKTVLSEPYPSLEDSVKFSLNWGHCATSRNVTGSISNEVIEILNRPNFFNHIMTLGSSQPLTEMSRRNFPRGIKDGRLVIYLEKIIYIQGVSRL
jgi:hypothetical protein